MEKQKNTLDLLLDSFESDMRIFIIINIVACLLFFTLNCYTPFFGDDIWHFTNASTGENIKAINEAAAESWRMYIEWTGRLIPMLLIRLLQLSPKALFNVLNTIIFCLMVNLIHKHAMGKSRSNSFFLLTLLGFWFCLENFGGTVLWASASIENMWASALVLLFLLPYNDLIRKHNSGEISSEKHSALFSVAFCIFGAIACSFTELNGITACAFILAIFLWRIINIFTASTLSLNKTSLWEITGFIGAVIGSVFVTFSPGQFVRLASVLQSKANQANIVLELGYRFLRTTFYFCENMIPLLFLFFIFLMICRLSDSNKELSLKQFLVLQNTAVCYLFAVFSSIYVWVLSKAYSTRFMTITVSMLLIAVGVMYAKSKLTVLSKGIVVIALLFAVLLASLQYLTVLYQMHNEDRIPVLRTKYTTSIYNPVVPVFHGSD